MLLVCLMTGCLDCFLGVMVFRPYGTTFLVRQNQLETIEKRGHGRTKGRGRAIRL